MLNHILIKYLSKIYISKQQVLIYQLVQTHLALILIFLQSLLLFLIELIYHKSYEYIYQFFYIIIFC